ncbi:acetyltransferase family protein, partial [Vibrio parahaemolyticus V-223/04]
SRKFGISRSRNCEIVS